MPFNLYLFFNELIMFFLVLFHYFSRGIFNKIFIFKFSLKDGKIFFKLINLFLKPFFLFFKIKYTFKRNKQFHIPDNACGRSLWLGQIYTNINLRCPA